MSRLECALGGAAAAIAVELFMPSVGTLDGFLVVGLVGVAAAFLTGFFRAAAKDLDEHRRER